MPHGTTAGHDSEFNPPPSAAAHENRGPSTSGNPKILVGKVILSERSSLGSPLGLTAGKTPPCTPVVALASITPPERSAMTCSMTEQ